MPRLVIMTLLVAVLASACSSEVEEPPALPSIGASVAATPATTPSPAAVSVPSAAREATPEGAAAFARFFYAEVERAYQEKSPAIISALSASACSACDRFVESVTELRDDGGRVTAVSYQIKAAEVPALQGEVARVTVIYDSPAIQGFDAAGNVVREEPAVTDFEEQLDLVLGPGGWLVQAVTVT